MWGSVKYSPAWESGDRQDDSDLFLDDLSRDGLDSGGAGACIVAGVVEVNPLGFIDLL